MNPNIAEIGHRALETRLSIFVVLRELQRNYYLHFTWNAMLPKCLHFTGISSHRFVLSPWYVHGTLRLTTTVE